VQHFSEDTQAAVGLLLGSVAEVEPQSRCRTVRMRKERLARHEGNAAVDRLRQEQPRIERTLRREPEEQAAARRRPRRKLAEMPREAIGEKVALSPVRRNDPCLASLA